MLYVCVGKTRWVKKEEEMLYVCVYIYIYIYIHTCMFVLGGRAGDRDLLPRREELFIITEPL